MESVFENGVMNHEDGATEEELFHISTLIVSYLLQGYCIGAPKNVDPQEFTDYIFGKYGHDGYISEERKLNLNGVTQRLLCQGWSYTSRRGPYIA